MLNNFGLTLKNNIWVITFVLNFIANQQASTSQAMATASTSTSVQDDINAARQEQRANIVGELKEFCDKRPHLGVLDYKVKSNIYNQRWKSGHNVLEMIIYRQYLHR